MAQTTHGVGTYTMCTNFRRRSRSRPPATSRRWGSAMFRTVRDQLLLLFAVRIQLAIGQEKVFGRTV